MDNNYQALFQAAAQKYGVPPALLMAQAQAESGFDPNAVSSTGATGIMQISPSNYQAYGVTNPTDPAQSIDAGAHLLADNLKASHGNQNLALAMYHGGGDPANWGPKTHAYVQAVNKNMDTANGAAEFDKLYGGSSQASASPSPASDPTQAALEFDKLYGGSSSTPSAPPTHGNLATSFFTGVHDVLQPGADLIARGMDATGITPAWNSLVGALGGGDRWKADTAAQLAAKDAHLHQEYDQNYANTLTGQLARGTGQVAASMPLLMSGENLVGAGADVVGGATGGTAGNVIRATGNFLTGNAGNTKGLGGLAYKGLSKAAEGALLGTASGGLLPSTPGETATGDALAGAVSGPVGSVAGKALGKVSGVVGNALSGFADASPEATASVTGSRVWNALVKDGIDPGAVIPKMIQMGPHATLVDAASALLNAKGGGNVRNLAEVAANSPGEGQAIASQVYGQRMDNQGARISQAVQNATGSQGTVYDDAQALMNQRSKLAQPLYAKAFQANITPDARLTQLLSNPLMGPGVKTVSQIDRNLADAKGVPFDEMQYQLPENGPIPMNVLDAAKRGLDNVVESYRDPVTGKLALDAIGRSVNELRSAFVDHLDSLNPDYAAARQAWAGPSQSLDALNLGQRALTNDPEVTAKIVSSLAPGDQQFFLAGVTKALQDKIAATPDGANAVRRIFGNQAIRDKIQAAIGNADAFNRFQQQMENEAQFAQTGQSVLAGSPTARRLAGMVDQSGWVEPLQNALAGNHAGLLKNAANFLTQPTENQMDSQARLLFSQDPAYVDEMLAKGAPGAAKNLLTGAARAGAAARTPVIETYRHTQ